MALFAGANAIAAVYKGSTAIGRIYHGSDLIFDGSGIAPLPVIGIRGARSEAVNTNLVNFALPTGSLEGDRLVLIASHAWNPTVSADFTLIAQTVAVNFGGGVLHRVLSAGDISAGYVTVPFAGSGRGVLHGITLEGTSQIIRNVTPVWDSGTSNPETIASAVSLEAGDLVLAGGGRRIDSDVVCDFGTEQSKAQGTLASGVLNAGVLPTAGIVEAEFTYSTTQYSYHALVAMVTTPEWAATSTRWRLFMPDLNQSGGTNHAFRRVEMRALPSGPTLCGQGTPTSGTFISGTYSPDKAFDWVNDTLWASNGVGDQWIEYEFAEAVHVGELSLTIQTEDWSPTSVNVEYWDGATWVTYWTAMPGTWTANETKVMTMAPAIQRYRYWRVADIGPPQADSPTIGSVGLSELKLASNVGGPSLPVSSITTTADPYTGRVIGNLLDDDLQSVWSGNPGSSITMDLGSSKPVVEIRFTNYNDRFGSKDGIPWAVRQAPMKFYLQGSDDGSTWVDVLGSASLPVAIPTWTTHSQERSFDFGLGQHTPPISGMFAWYDAKDATSITLTSGAVSQWNDKSGNARHVVQATAGNRPIYGDVDGQPGVVFDGLGDRLHCASFPLAQPCTVFAVTKTPVDTSGLGQRNMFDSDTGGRIAGGMFGTSHFLTGTASILRAEWAAAQISQMTYLANGAGTSAIRKGGIEIATGVVNASTMTNLNIGSGQTGGYAWVGPVYELLFYEGVLSDADILTTEQYLADKWGTLFSATSYTNAGGSGDRTGIVSVTATNIGAAQGNPSQMLDGSQTNTYSLSSGSNDGTNTWTFDFGTPKVVDAFAWYQHDAVAYSHGMFAFEGSPDNSTWTQIGGDFTLGGALKTIHYFTPNATAYRYHRLRGISGSRSANPFLREIEFKIS